MEEGLCQQPNLGASLTSSKLFITDIALHKQKHTQGIKYLQGDDQNKYFARFRKVESKHCSGISQSCISRANHKQEARHSSSRAGLAGSSRELFYSERPPLNCCYSTASTHMSQTKHRHGRKLERHLLTLNS